MNIFHKHRLLKSINEVYMNKGLNRIFLKGNALTDLFLWDLREGFYPLVKSLEMYALDRSFDWFINVNKEGSISFLKRESDQFIESNYDGFINKNHNPLANMMLQSMSNRNVPTDEEAVDNAVDGQREEVVQFNAIVNSLLSDQNQGNVVLHIEDFDWFAGFYSDEREHSKVRKLQLLENCRQHLIIASFRDMTTLQEVFRFDVEGDHVVTLGEPTKEEIFMTLTRVFWSDISHVPRSFDLESLAASMAAAGYSLRQCISILRNILISKDDKIQLTDFSINKEVSEEVYWEDVKIDKEIKLRILNMVEAFKNGTEASRKGLLLTGPPGTGKTMIAKALANEAKMYFMSRNLSDLKGEFVGQSAPKVRKIFEEARLHEPTIIFLDEVDTLFPMRSSINSDSFTDDMVNEFLTQLDGATTGKQRIFVVAATNRPQLLDSAVRSRLGDPIEISLPKKEAREDLFKSHLSKLSTQFWEILNHQNRQILEIRSEGMSGREIKNFCIDLSNRIQDDSEWEQADTDANLFFEKHFGNQFNVYQYTLIEELGRSTGIQFYSGVDLQANNLYGCDDVIRNIQPYFDEIVEDPKKKNLRLDRYNILPKRGILLYGPPGNGKTEIVSKLAHDNEFYLVKIESKDIVNPSERVVLERLEDIFSHVVRLSKACNDKNGIIMFFDEFDQLAGPQMTSTVRGTLLRILADKEGIRHPHTKVVLMAATNFVNTLDEATIRKGRFDEHIFINHPNKISALQILTSLLNDKKRHICNQASSKGLEDLYDEQIRMKKDVIRRDFEKHNRDLKIYRPDAYRDELELAISHCALSGAEIRSIVENLLRLAFEKSMDTNLKDDLIIDDELIHMFIFDSFGGAAERINQELVNVGH